MACRSRCLWRDRSRDHLARRIWRARIAFNRIHRAAGQPTTTARGHRDRRCGRTDDGRYAGRYTRRLGVNRREFRRTSCPHFALIAPAGRERRVGRNRDRNAVERSVGVACCDYIGASASRAKPARADASGRSGCVAIAVTVDRHAGASCNHGCSSATDRNRRRAR